MLNGEVYRLNKEITKFYDGHISCFL